MEALTQEVVCSELHTPLLQMFSNCDDTTKPLPFSANVSSVMTLKGTAAILNFFLKVPTRMYTDMILLLLSQHKRH